jgi:arsenate reductase-like glutaredoxin family protein
MGVKFSERELAKEPLSPDEIRRLSGGDPVSLIDRRKPSFKKLGVGDRTLSDDEAIDLMTQEPSIIRRPIFEIDGEILFGFNQQELERLLA